MCFIDRCLYINQLFFFFSSRRRHTRFALVSWARNVYKRQSYNSPDAVNAIDWSFKTRYGDLYNYYRGLIALRKAHPAFRLGDADLVRKHLEFLDAPDGVVAWRLTGHAGGDPCEEIVVVINSRKEAVSVEVPDTDAGTSYTAYCRNGRISVDGLGTLTGPVLTVGPQQALIAGR